MNKLPFTRVQELQDLQEFKSETSPMKVKFNTVAAIDNLVTGVTVVTVVIVPTVVSIVKVSKLMKKKKLNISDKSDF